MMSTNRAFKGVWIPAEVWLHPNLSLIEKAILQEIDSLDGDNGCFASNKHFANFCNCSDKTVSASIGKLVDMGLVERLEVNNRRILHTKLQNLSASKNYSGASKNYSGVSKNYSPYSNTLNNTDIPISKDIDKTPKKEPKKSTKNNPSELFDLVNDLFPKDDTYLECNKYLTRYLELRLSNRGRITLEAFSILVDNLLTISAPNSKGKTRETIKLEEVNTQLCVDVIKQSIKGGKNGLYLNFFYPDHYSKGTKTANPDNSSGNVKLDSFDETKLVQKEY